MVLFFPIDCFWSKIIFYPFVDSCCWGPITALSLVQDHMHVSMCIFKQDFNFSTLHFDCSFLFSCGRTHMIWQQTTFVQDFCPMSGLRTASKLDDHMTRKKKRTEAMRKSYKNIWLWIMMINDDWGWDERWWSHHDDDDDDDDDAGDVNHDVEKKWSTWSWQPFFVIFFAKNN